MDSIRACIFNGRPAPSTHDTLELARIGTCQPHGVIMVVDPRDGLVEHVSANCTTLLGVEPHEILAQRATAAFPDAEAAATIEEILQPGRLYFDNPQRVVVNDTAFEVICHRRDEHLFIELEPYVEASNDYQTMVAHALDLLSRQATRSGLYSSSVELMQYVTGWDRVKLYKFVSHGHGVVVAEKRSPDSKLPTSFLNHYFSAADIPESAKEILRTGKTRQKPTQAPSVLLLTRGPDGAPVPSGDAVDLTDCWLRGIHACDNGYNTNLGVGSNIIFPVMVDSEIWGLFVVHNREERFLNYDCRVVIEQMTMMFIARLLEVEESEARIRERYDTGNGLLKAIEEAEGYIASASRAAGANGKARTMLVETMRRGALSLTPTCPNPAPVESSGRRSGDHIAGDLLSLVRADGAAICRPGLGGHLHLVGQTPEPLEVRGIASLFGAGLPAFGDGEWRVFATDALGDFTDLPDGVLSKAAGLLAAPIGTEGDLIMWFREEQVLDVTWAGRPWTRQELASDRMFRSRDNFTPTAGQLGGASRPWLDAEVVIAARFCAAIAAFWERARPPEPASEVVPMGGYRSFPMAGQAAQGAFR